MEALNTGASLHETSNVAKSEPSVSIKSIHGYEHITLLSTLYWQIMGRYGQIEETIWLHFFFLNVRGFPSVLELNT